MTVPPAAAHVPDRPAASDLITALRDKAPRLAMAIATAQLAWPAVQRLRAKARERATYTVKVPGDDELYNDLHEWVLGLLPRGEQHALVAWSARRGLIMEGPGRPAPAPTLRLRYDGTRVQTITVAGHRIMVAVSETPLSDEDRRWKPPEIMFTAGSLTARDALLTEIAQAIERKRASRRTPTFRMFGRWGEWVTVDDLPPRDLDSVILPPGQLDRLVGDVGRFLAAEQEYVRRCIPWHRGHLYEGPPGTGKTSVARAIASHFGMDVWYLPLADVKKDGTLLQVVGQISPRSLLLLEDVDVFHAATERDDEGGVTLSGLLNSLDGIATPHGLLTVLTSNAPEALDPAIIRPGRVDLVESFGLADSRQAARLIARWYGLAEPPRVDGGGVLVAPSLVIETCKRSETAREAIADLQTLRTRPAAA